MRVKKLKADAIGFQPYKLEIYVDSKEEHYDLNTFLDYNTSIPDLLNKKSGGGIGERVREMMNMIREQMEREAQ